MKLRQARIKNNLTQSEVASKLGVCVSTISQYENCKRKPNITTLKKLTQLFNCTVDDLIE